MTGLAAAGAVMALGTALSAGSSILGGMQAKAAAKADADAAEAEARSEARAARDEAEQRAAEVSRILARQRLLASASGLGYSGSLLDLAQRTGGEGARSVRQAIYAGELARVRGASEARRLRYAGRSAFVTGVLGGVGRAASGVGALWQPGSGPARGFRMTDEGGPGG